MNSLQFPLSLYFHVPFCSTKCTYCAFNTYVKMEPFVEPFVDALIREITILGKSQPGQLVGTVFFGGGTPSLLTNDQFGRILSAIGDHFVVQADAEISIEANPNDLDIEYLTALRQVGVNRLSIGVQSAVESELRLYHRRHDHETSIRAVDAARQAGFANLNLDLIYGAPYQSLAQWEVTVREALRLSPDHISLYALGVEEGTPLHKWVHTGHVPSPDDDLAADMYELATTMLGEAGFEQYEISNWSKPGFECRHNLQYWRNLPYAGLGPGAHGFAGGVRYATVLLPPKYIQLLQAANGHYQFPYTPAVAEAVIVDQRNEIAETLIMGLRLTREGIQRDVFLRRFGMDLLELHGRTLNRFQDYGLVSIDDRVVRLTSQGRLLSNMLFRELV